MTAPALPLPVSRYAVVWSDGTAACTGRLEVHANHVELHGRDTALVVPLADVAEATIERAPADRLRGLPVLALRRRDGSHLRIASLDGPGALLELAALTSR
jgi:hypothetical protein